MRWLVPALCLCFGSACEAADGARDTRDTSDSGDTSEVRDDTADDGEVAGDSAGDTDDTGETGDSSDTGDTKLEAPDAHPCPEWERPPETRLWHQDEVAQLALRLPVPDGVEAVVSQGNDGEFSHFGDQRFAWDFAVPYGTPVHAAASGVVVWVEDTQLGAGPGVEWRELANFIVLDHGGGLFSSYVHLAVGSALVAPGDVALAGQVLAETGESGQLTGPHLHFQVENVWSESVPAVFARGLACDWVPSVGERVVGRPVRLSTEVSVSELPAASFEEDGVVEAAGLPARLLSRSEAYSVSGRAPARAATEVYFLALPPTGGAAVFAQRFPVAANRTFGGKLELAELPEGQYGWALVAGTGQAVRVPRSVRAAVVD